VVVGTAVVTTVAGSVVATVGTIVVVFPSIVGVLFVKFVTASVWLVVATTVAFGVAFGTGVEITVAAAELLMVITAETVGITAHRAIKRITTPNLEMLEEFMGKSRSVNYKSVFFVFFRVVREENRFLEWCLFTR